MEKDATMMREIYYDFVLYNQKSDGTLSVPATKRLYADLTDDEIGIFKSVYPRIKFDPSVDKSTEKYTGRFKLVRNLLLLKRNHESDKALQSALSDIIAFLVYVD